MITTRPLCVLAATLWAAGGATAQGLPDCLVGNSDDGYNNILRLIDRDADGYYDSTSAGQDETYDFYGVEFVFHDTRFTDVLASPWQAGAFYVIDGNFSDHRDAIITYFPDIDGNGVIEQAETLPAMTEAFTEGDPESEAMATDGQAIYWIRNAGAMEGVWRSEDLNGDGDFMDTVLGVDETTPAVVEASGDAVNGSDAHPIANQSSGAVFNPSEVQRISFDPWSSPGSLGTGRFIIEEENLDQSLALEDLNGDGDFYDAGEIYLWAAMYNGGGLSGDVHPDVAGALLPSCNDWSKMAIDSSTAPTTYYVLNTDGGSTSPDGNSIWRCQDLNLDGDVNDAGEVNLYLQATDLDPVLPFNFFNSIALWNGDFYALGDALTPVEHDQIIRMIDANLDNTIDNATEVVSVFDMAGDPSGLEQLNFFAPGALASAPAGFPATATYIDDATCTGTGGTVHKLRLGGSVYGDDVPKLGRTVRLVTYGAPATAPTALHLGGLFPMPISLDSPSDTCFLTVDPGSGAVISPFMSGPGGDVLIDLSIPAASGLEGVNLHFQTVSIDLGVNPFNVTLSNSLRLQFGSYGYATPMTAP